MSSCPACDRAEQNARTGVYQSSCMGCDARALAQSPGAFQREADNAELLTAGMRQIWPEQAQYKRGRVLVWNWIQRLENHAA